MSSSIVCLIGDAPNHLALVHAINQKFGVKGLVIDTKKSVLKRYARPFCLKLKEKFLFGKINKAWHSMQKFYSHSTREIEVEKVLRVNSINDPQVISFLQDTKPDLIVVSGTSIIKEPLVSFPLRVGMLNLHTGLSPYVKGGPNCTNWGIVNNEWEYRGTLIMWLSSGIDSGNIIATGRVEDFEETELARSAVGDDFRQRVAVKLDGGLKAPATYIHQETIIKGDAKELVIGLASIMAKVTRDQYMERQAKKAAYKAYGLAVHKGYGTKSHRELIKLHGLSKEHRQSFCRQIFGSCRSISYQQSQPIV